MDEYNRSFEIEHTADWALKIKADTLENLFIKSLSGMYHLANAAACADAYVVKSIGISGPNPEFLLVEFLNEALFFLEVEQKVFDIQDIQLSKNQITVEVKLRDLESVEKEIKAATYAGLKITHTDKGFSAAVVFDV